MSRAKEDISLILVSPDPYSKHDEKSTRGIETPSTPWKFFRWRFRSFNRRNDDSDEEKLLEKKSLKSRLQSKLSFTFGSTTKKSLTRKARSECGNSVFQATQDPTPATQDAAQCRAKIVQKRKQRLCKPDHGFPPGNSNNNNLASHFKAANPPLVKPIEKTSDIYLVTGGGTDFEPLISGDNLEPEANKLNSIGQRDLEAELKSKLNRQKRQRLRNEILSKNLDESTAAEFCGVPVPSRANNLCANSSRINDFAYYTTAPVGYSNNNHNNDSNNNEDIAFNQENRSCCPDVAASLGTQFFLSSPNRRKNAAHLQKIQPDVIKSYFPNIRSTSYHCPTGKDNSATNHCYCISTGRFHSSGSSLFPAAMNKPERLVKASAKHPASPQMNSRNTKALWKSSPDYDAASSSRNHINVEAMSNFRVASDVQSLTDLMASMPSLSDSGSSQYFTPSASSPVRSPKVSFSVPRRDKKQINSSIASDLQNASASSSDFRISQFNKLASSPQLKKSTKKRSDNISCQTPPGMSDERQSKAVTWAIGHSKRPSLTRSFSAGSMTEQEIFAPGVQTDVQHRPFFSIRGRSWNNSSDSTTSPDNSRKSSKTSKGQGEASTSNRLIVDSDGDQSKKSPGTMKKKRSFAQPIAKKLSFLRRRPTDANLMRLGAQSEERPCSENINAWAQSFEKLLQSPDGLKYFRLFLQREFSDENIEFWLACDHYKRIHDPQIRRKRSTSIFKEFIAFQAPKEVNLDSSTRTSTIEILTEFPDSVDLFDTAQHRIQSLMAKDSYPRFLRSDIYLNLVRHLRPSAEQ